jgi:hypothetical protein
MITSVKMVTGISNTNNPVILFIKITKDFMEAYVILYINPVEVPDPPLYKFLLFIKFMAPPPKESFGQGGDGDPDNRSFRLEARSVEKICHSKC